MLRILKRSCVSLLTSMLLTGCGFHLQSATPLSPVLKHLYLQTQDPYGTLTGTLKQSLKAAHVYLVDTPEAGTATLAITQVSQTQVLLSVNATQQTRQYALYLTVSFAVYDPKGRSLLDTQTLVEYRPITIQSSQVLGSSNELNLFYQQMQRTMVQNILSRLASDQVTRLLEAKPAA